MAICHGCNGKGWVETAGGLKVHVCPLCNGVGWFPDAASSTSPNTQIDKEALLFEQNKEVESNDERRR